MEYRTCTKCNETKEITDYYERKDNLSRRRVCKRCCNAQRRYDLVSNMLSNASYRAKKNHLAFDLDKDYLLSLREQQDNRCALTGWELDWDPTKSGKRKCPYNRASIDRIDSSLGYTRDNVQLLADMVNRIKMNYDQDLFLHMCASISAKNTAN